LFVAEENIEKRRMTPGNPSKSLTMTFRINGNVLKKMRENAEDRDISLNTLANQIFKRYVEWDSYQPKLGMIPMARPVVIQL
jgi:predicted HicB family RNase H-like nuclease